MRYAPLMLLALVAAAPAPATRPATRPAARAVTPPHLPAIPIAKQPVAPHAPIDVFVHAYLKAWAEARPTELPVQLWAISEYEGAGSAVFMTCPTTGVWAPYYLTFYAEAGRWELYDARAFTTTTQPTGLIGDQFEALPAAEMARLAKLAEQQPPPPSRWSLPSDRDTRVTTRPAAAAVGG